MSDLSNLKERINALAEAARKTASGLAQFDHQFAQQTGEVQASIGGSAQRKDQEMVTALQKASQAVRQASEALNEAGRVGTQYGQSL